MGDNEIKVSPGINAGGHPSSRQVNWFEVFQFVERWVRSKSSEDLNIQLPIAGTPQWCAMPDTDARKLMAVIIGGIREALNHEVVQEHRAAASRDVASSTDWSTIARRVRTGRGDAYVPRKAS